MAVPGRGLLHFNIRVKRKDYPSKDQLKNLFDKFIYIIVFLVPIMNLPQLLQIWVNKDASGVSLISWTSFSIFSFIWFVYGTIHKDKPIIIMNSTLMIIQAYIAYGVYLYG